MKEPYEILKLNHKLEKAIFKFLELKGNICYLEKYTYPEIIEAKNQILEKLSEKHKEIKKLAEEILKLISE